MIYKIQDTTLEGIANAIRAKSGTEETIQVEDFEYAILNIDTGENTASAAESAKSAKESANSANTSELAAAEHAGRAAISEANAGDHADRAEAAAETAAVDAVAKVQELLNDEVERAETAANNAETSEINAAKHADDAAASVKSAESIVNEAEYNAENFINEAESKAETLIAEAESKAQSAAESAKIAQETIWDATGATSEAWAKGTMQGVEVASDHETYQNNSKYWCDQAKLAVQDASFSVATANVYAQAEVTA